MKIAPEGIVDRVTIIQGTQMGHYVMLIKNNGQLLCEYEMGVSFLWLQDTTEWKVHFLLAFIKAGWLQYRFQMIHSISGDTFDMYADKKFGKALLNLIQSQQLLT